MNVLTEQDTSGSREILGGDRTLDGNHRDLESSSPTETGNDLVSNPLSSRGVDIEGVEETSTDGSKSGATKEEGLVVTEGRDKTTAKNGRDGDGDNEGQVMNTTGGRSVTMNRLEVDGDIVDGEEEATGKDEGESAHDPDGSVLDDSRGDHGSVTLPPLENTPSSHDENEADKETDDLRGTPLVLLTTILDGQDVRDSGTHHQNNAQGIHLSELLESSSLDRDGIAGSLEEDEDNESGNTTNGEVDVEAPSP